MKYISYLISIFSILCMVCSCSLEKSGSAEFTEESFKESFHLTNGTIYKNDSLLLGRPGKMLFHPDSFLVIIDSDLQKQVKIIDLKNNTIQEIIAHGRGPGEMIATWEIRTINKYLYTFCIQLKKVIVLAPDENRKFQIIDEFNLGEKLSMDFFPLKKDLFLCLSLGDEKRVTFLNGKGKVIKKFGDFPPFKSSNNIEGDNDIFQSSITANPNGSKFVLACRRTDILEIYNTNTEEVKRIQGPLGIKLTVIDHGIAKSTDPSYSTYLVLNANENEFWVSYSGYKWEKGRLPSNAEQYPKQIYCFDWNGKPLRRIEFNNEIIGFDLDWTNNVLYCIEYHDLYPELVSYKLDGILD